MRHFKDKYREPFGKWPGRLHATFSNRPKLRKKWEKNVINEYIKYCVNHDFNQTVDLMFGTSGGSRSWIVGQPAPQGQKIILKTSSFFKILNKIYL